MGMGLTSSSDAPLTFIGPQVLLKVPITYISIPILDRRYLAKAKKPKRSKSSSTRIWGRKGNTRGKARKTAALKKTKCTPPTVYCQWPVLNPAHVFSQLVASQSFSLLQADGWSWHSFWQTAASEDFGRSHPVLEMDVSQQDKAVAISFHGDEGSGKRQKNVLILSWSSTAVHGKSELTKFPFAVPWPFFAFLYFQFRF